MKTFKFFPFTLMSILLMSTFGQAQSRATCQLTLNSYAKYHQEAGQTPVIEVQLTEDALKYFRQQFYLPGYLGQSLNQFCAWGEPLSSQVAYILSHVIANSKESSLNIRILADEQLSPYTFESRTATIWVQGVEQTITLPGSRPFARKSQASIDPYSTIDPSLPQVIGATYFTLAQLHQEGQPFELVKTLKAASLAGATIDYRLTLELKHDTETEIHQIIVRSSPWIGSWELMSDVVVPRSAL